MPELKVTIATIAAALSSVGLAMVRHLPVDEAAVNTLVLAAATYVAAWLAPHTPRPSP